MDNSILSVLGLVFIATLIRSTFGFGEAVVLVPILVLFMPMNVAVPLALMLSVTIAVSVLAQDWRQVRWSSAAWLVVAALIGTPIGKAMLTSNHANMVKAGLALFIVLFAGFSAFIKQPPELKKDSIPCMLAVGFCAGILGGAYGMFGPLLVIYGALRRWGPNEFRATVQGYSFPVSSVALFGEWHDHLITPSVLNLYGWSLLTAVPAIVLGSIINHRLKAGSFIRYVYVGLMLVGIGLLIQVAPMFVKRVQKIVATRQLSSVGKPQASEAAKLVGVPGRRESG